MFSDYYGSGRGGSGDICGMRLIEHLQGIMTPSLLCVMRTDNNQCSVSPSVFLFAWSDLAMTVGIPCR